jgi:acylglycerol lipase
VAGVDRREGRFEGAAGIEIVWQAWLPEGEPKANVVVVHGASEHGGRYRYAVERLVPAGYAMWIADHRGHGRSEGPPAFIDRLENAVADLDRFVDLVTGEGAGEHPLMLGHSMGGCIAVEYALEYQDKLAALALSSPLLTLGAASARTRAVSRVFSTVRPTLPLFRVDATRISRDPDEVRAYDEDPLVHRGGLPARTVNELAKAIHTFPARVPEIDLPLLVMVGSGDRVVPPDGGVMLYERASSEDKALKLYDGLYHELMNEVREDRERVLDDLVEWFDAHAPARRASRARAKSA